MSFFTRDELLGGLPVRRASTLLFAIESRTAAYVIEARQAAARYLGEKTAAAQERAFLEALSEGRDAPSQLAIYDLERYAPHWASLIPSDVNLRAAVAHLLSEKYRFTYESVPSLRGALGLDDEAVRQSYERLYGRPLAAIYVPRLSVREQVRWSWARLARWLDDLPPFWTAYALTLTETVGAGILALPIALAGVGPLAGIVLLVVLGLVNMATIAGMTEAVARNGNVRYGRAYFGRVVSDSLGRPGAVVLTLSLVALTVMALSAYYVGLATTVAGATAVPAAVWAALLFLVHIYYARRTTLNTTIASALVIGFINIVLLVVMSLLALPHAATENLAYVNLPFVAGRPFEPALLGLIFGVILTGYFGHLSTGVSARLVLRREPHGRSLIWGNLAAMGTAVALSVVWVVAVNGAIAPSVLRVQTGTALTPLATLIGPWFNVCGLLFATLSMGMASVHYSLALANQIREWLPEPSTSAGGGLKKSLSGARGRLAIGILPVAAVFAIVEWQLLSGSGSFTGMFWSFGVIIPVLGGIFPILMMVAGRRKGDFALAGTIGWLGHPVVVAGIYLFFLAAIFLHGLIIWQDPLQRLMAFAAGTIVLALTLVSIRRGAFSTRAIVEIRADQGEGGVAVFTITIDGKPSAGEVHLRYFDGERLVVVAGDSVAAFDSLHSATFQLGPTRARELKVWTHRITPEGQSHGLAARLEVQHDGEIHRMDLGQSNGQVLVPLKSLPCAVELTFA